MKEHGWYISLPSVSLPANLLLPLQKTPTETTQYMSGWNRFFRIPYCLHFISLSGNLCAILLLRTFFNKEHFTSIYIKFFQNIRSKVNERIVHLVPTVLSLQHLGHSQQLLISVTILQLPLVSSRQDGCTISPQNLHSIRGFSSVLTFLHTKQRTQVGKLGYQNK